ncbi:hypothetical protein FQN49_000271 [Arthroderma sp. PD_2]|nr:hypothetical protein FQN49_000271 [Arthroderma sp. PD_2]
MLPDNVKLISQALAFFVPYLFRYILQCGQAVYHSWTWRNTPDAKNVVVLGGSFAGIELVNRLVDTLPTGYKVVLIEKNSHFNYSFNFPRFSVMRGHEHKAFIPYNGIASAAPAGIFRRVQDTAVGLTETQVILSSGDKIDYAILAIATGSSQPLPVQVTATEHGEACHELQGVQEIIMASHKIAIVGGGAVGVELASDIKDFYPDKEVTLIHSRDRLLSHFGRRLGDYTLTALQDELNIRVLLQERPEIPAVGNMARSAKLTLSDGCVEEFDLIIGCTGQRPNSAILSSLLPSAISKESSRILVQPTLEILTASVSAPDMGTHIFALGDVADHPGPRMARAGWMQASVVVDNILAIIRREKPSQRYTPNVFLEGAIKLTLGKTHNVVYAMSADGSDVLVPARNNRLDLGIERAWKQYGVGGMFKMANKGFDKQHLASDT